MQNNKLYYGLLITILCISMPLIKAAGSLPAAEVFAALKAGNTATVLAYLDEGGDAEIEDPADPPADLFAVAAMKNNVTIGAALLAKNCDVHKIYGELNLIHTAIAHSSVAFTKWLLDQGLAPATWTYQDHGEGFEDSGITQTHNPLSATVAFIVAPSYQYVEMVTMLLSHPAVDKHFTTFIGGTTINPLELAVIAGKWDLAKLLINADIACPLLEDALLSAENVAASPELANLLALKHADEAAYRANMKIRLLGMADHLIANPI